MAFSLTRRGVLAKLKNVTAKGPGRSAMVSVASGGVGLAAGKSQVHRKKIVIGSLVVGAAANVVGMNSVGDGLMAGGATLLGYKLGAKRAAGGLPMAARPGFPARRKG